MNNYLAVSEKEPRNLAKTDKPASAIESAFGRLEEAHERLMKDVSVLANKVQPVCRSEPEENKKECPDRGQDSTPVAERINRATDTAQSIHRQVRALIDKIEL